MATQVYTFWSADFSKSLQIAWSPKRYPINKIVKKLRDKLGKGFKYELAISDPTKLEPIENYLN